MSPSNPRPWWRHLPLLLAGLAVGLPWVVNGQERPRAAATAASASPIGADPSRLAVNGHLKAAPKRKSALLLQAPKPESATAAGTPAGRPPRPVVRSRAPKAKR